MMPLMFPALEHQEIILWVFVVVGVIAIGVELAIEAIENRMK